MNNKEVVHCKTKEEWDFVKSKCPPGYRLSKEPWDEKKLKEYPEGLGICLKESAYCGLNYWAEYKYTILSFEDWCKKEGHKPDFMKKPEIGKWYKEKNQRNPGHYGKLTGEYNNGHFPSKDYIYNKKYFDDGYFFMWKNLIEVPLSEIQQYLPSGHPDLIEFRKGDYIVVLRPKEKDTDFIKHNWCYIHNGKHPKRFSTDVDCIGTEIDTFTIPFSDTSTWRYAFPNEIEEYNRRGNPYNVSELTKNVTPNTDFIFEPGGYYVGSWGGKNDVIFKATTNSLNSINPGIDIKGIFSYSIFCTGTGINFRTATSEEKEWLDLCIRHNKTMPKPKDLVGRYLKALVNYPQCIGRAKKGHIFEITKLEEVDSLLIKDSHGAQWRASIPEIGTTWELMPKGFSPNDTFALPEKWYVQCGYSSEEYPEILKWRGDLEWYIGYMDSDKTWWPFPPKRFTEITFEQFKKYVLKEEEESSEEISTITPKASLNFEHFHKKWTEVLKKRENVDIKGSDYDIEAKIKNSSFTPKQNTILIPKIYIKSEPKQQKQFTKISLIKTKKYGK